MESPGDLELIVRLALAAGLGIVIGLERRLRDHPAGARTHGLVALGACLFTIAGLTIEGDASPGRIAAGVVAGIGFLGAGLIFRGSEGGIHNLTTAASIWIAAALGVAAGTGGYLIAGVAAALALGLLALDRLPGDVGGP